MESANQLIFILASSSLWLAASGLVLWLCLRSRLQLSPGTRAVASILVVIQGWVWIGIPVEIDPTWLGPQPSAMAAHLAAAVPAVPATTPLSLNSKPSDLGSFSESRSLSRSGPTLGSTSLRLMSVGLCGIWLAGIAVLLWRSIRGFAALSRMVQGLPCAPVEWQNELTAICRQRSIARAPVLKISNVAAPMLAQTWRGICIVVPAWLWDSYTADQRAGILLHELTHYRRGDLWRQLAMRLLVLPHWFNPVAWWATAQFEAASESACDDAVCGGDPALAISYSKTLLGLNERLSIRYAQALAMSGGSVTERIRRILHPDFQKESQMSRFLVLSAMVVLIGLATIRIHAAETQSSSKSDSTKNKTTKKEPAGSNAASLLSNGGFEEFSKETGEPLSWYATRIPYPLDEKGKRSGPVLAGHYLMSTSPNLAHSGTRCVMIAVGDNHPDLPVAYNWTTEVQGWKAGETYELSGWIKVEKVNRSAFIMVQFWGENEEKKSSQWIGGAWAEEASPVTGDKEWTKVSTRFTVPEGTSVLRLRAGLASEENRGAKAWLDDLALVKVASN